jgi:hypothetical protein
VVDVALCEQPTPATVSRLADLLDQESAADLAFAEEFRDRWARVHAAVIAEEGGVVNSVSGDVSGTVVQARDVHGGSTSAAALRHPVAAVTDQSTGRPVMPSVAIVPAMSPGQPRRNAWRRASKPGQEPLERYQQEVSALRESSFRLFRNALANVPISSRLSQDF